MSNIKQKQEEIVQEFSIFEDWMEKYEYIIELGKDLSGLDELEKTDDKLIEGCQSRVWLKTEVNDGSMSFYADSEAIIAKGIIGLLIRVFDNESPEEIVKAELDFIDEIGLREHLSITRSNGLLGMIKKIKT
ncbi:MAG: SufE family protein, partial [Crocinitomicaceae bacterium]